MKPLLKWIWYSSLGFQFILSGCVHKEVLDDISLIEGIGFDHSKDGEIVGTITFPLYVKDAPPKNQTSSAEAAIKKTILQEIQKQTSDPVVTGSLEVILFGKKIAKEEGILELIDAFQRDPGVGAGLYLAVIDGEAKTVLEGEYGIRGNGTYLANLIEYNVKQEEIPRTNLHLFLADFYQEGKTPYLPQLKQMSKDNIEITGIALFSQGKVIDVVPSDQMFFFKLLSDRFSQGLYRVKVDEGDAAIRSISSSHRFKLTNRNPEEISIHIKVKGTIDEFTGNSLTPKMIDKLERQFEADINKKCLTLLERFKEKQLDPIGLGRFVKTQSRNFDIKKWRNTEYQNLRFKVTSDVIIMETGVIQ